MNAFDWDDVIIDNCMDQISQALLNMQRMFTADKKSLRSRMSFLTAVDALTPQDFSFSVLTQIYTTSFHSFFLLPSIGLLALMSKEIQKAYSTHRQMKAGPEFYQKGVQIRATSSMLAFLYFGFSYVSLLLVHGNLAKQRRDNQAYTTARILKRQTGYIYFLKHCRRMGELIKEAKVNARNNRDK